MKKINNPNQREISFEQPTIKASPLIMPFDSEKFQTPLLITAKDKMLETFRTENAAVRRLIRQVTTPHRKGIPKKDILLENDRMHYISQYEIYMKSPPLDARREYLVAKIELVDVEKDSRAYSSKNINISMSLRHNLVCTCYTDGYTDSLNAFFRKNNIGVGDVYSHDELRDVLKKHLRMGEKAYIESGNTYNFNEYVDLMDTVEYRIITIEGLRDKILLVAFHLGVDVRSGYSRFIALRTRGEFGVYNSLVPEVSLFVKDKDGYNVVVDALHDGTNLLNDEGDEVYFNRPLRDSVFHLMINNSIA